MHARVREAGAAVLPANASLRRGEDALFAEARLRASHSDGAVVKVHLWHRGEAQPDHLHESKGRAALRRKEERRPLNEETAQPSS